MLCAMAQAGPTLHPAAYAAAVLLRDLKRLQKRAAVMRRAPTAEHVHRTRVAGRRLCNALHIFADVLPEDHHPWLKRLKRMMRALGAARDLDVQLLWLHGVIAQWKVAPTDPNLSGAHRLELRLSQQRRASRNDIQRAIHRLERSGVLESMHDSLKTLKRKCGPSRPTAEYKTAARRAIAERLKELLAFERFVHSPRRVNELHAMRIAAKHLRYTLEAYEDLLGSAAGKASDRVRHFQALLGELHDCDVWMETLPQFIRQERERYTAFFGHARGFAALEQGLTRLRENRQAERDRLYACFVKDWDQSVRRGLWRRLGGVIAGKDR